MKLLDILPVILLTAPLVGIAIHLFIKQLKFEKRQKEDKELNQIFKDRIKCKTGIESMNIFFSLMDMEKRGDRDEARKLILRHCEKYRIN